MIVGRFSLLALHHGFLTQFHVVGQFQRKVRADQHRLAIHRDVVARGAPVWMVMATLPAGERISRAAPASSAAAGERKIKTVPRTPKFKQKQRMFMAFLPSIDLARNLRICVDGKSELTL